MDYIHIIFLYYKIYKLESILDKMKKRICILSNGLFRGGTDTFVVNLVKGLNKEKYEITVVLSISENWLALRESEVIEAGASTIWTHDINNGIKGQIIHLIKLYKILKSGKFDVFQTNIDLFNGPNLFIAWLAKIPIRICHSHNSQQELEMSGGRNIAVSIYQKIMRKLCWLFSNRRCGCSELALDFLFEDKWKNDPKIKVINNGIDIDDFRIPIDIMQKKKNLNLSLKKKYILSVGRLSTQKNPLMIANIFKELCKIRNDCELLWVGIGEMENQLKQEFNNSGISDKVHFLGSRGDVNELMLISDAFLFPSLFEGLGIVVIEAQASGLPCLISNTIPMQVDCGGCIFEDLSNPVEIWAEKLNDILNKKIILSVDESKLSKYTITEMVMQMESLFY